MNIKIDANVCRACLQSGIGQSLITNQNLKDKFEIITAQNVSKNASYLFALYFCTENKMQT